MKKLSIALIFLFVFACVSSAAPLAASKSRAVPGASTVARKQTDSYRRNFYRGLSKRLGRNRGDYPHLTDEEFANFRAVATTGIGKGKLYRSSSPISTWGSRNVIADNAARAAGIKTFINLTDTQSGMKAHKGFPGSYYSKQAVIGLNLSTKYQSEDFRRGLVQGVRFMAAHEAPFLIHCSLGKDRAGFFCAILECLMGASDEEVTADYLVSFYNYFGINPGTRDYDLVANNEIRPSLALAFGVKDISNVDLAVAAERYLLKIGVSPDDIAAVRRKLGPASQGVGNDGLL